MNYKTVSCETKFTAGVGDGAGEFQAVIATMDVPDADRDVVTDTTFEDGVKVPIAAYGHQYNKPPIGKAAIQVDRLGRRVLANGSIFLDMEDGLNTWRSMRRLDKLQQFSWGFVVEKSHPDTVNGQRVQVLDRIKLWEVSPVLVGASVGTELISAKVAGGRSMEPLRLRNRLDRELRDAGLSRRGEAKALMAHLDRMVTDLAATPGGARIAAELLAGPEGLPMVSGRKSRISALRARIRRDFELRDWPDVPEQIVDSEMWGLFQTALQRLQMLRPDENPWNLAPAAMRQAWGI